MVQHEPHRPQEAFGTAELAELGGRQQALVDQFDNAIHFVQVAANPEQRVQIAQAALAFLQIGFDDIAAVTHALVARFALGELFSDECPRRAGHHFAAKPHGGLIEQGLISPGAVLTDAKKKHTATVHADGSLSLQNRVEKIQGSIHKVGAAVQGAPSCNGWTFWHYKENGKYVPIDNLRERARGETLN